jgi:hypothetical protein
LYRAPSSAQQPREAHDTARFETRWYFAGFRFIYAPL